jgi:hypothetical protein
MKRIAAPALAFLLLGAAVNVGVAWACIAAARTSKSHPARGDQNDQRCVLDAPDEFPVCRGMLRHWNDHVGVTRSSWLVMLLRKPVSKGEFNWMSPDREYEEQIVDCGWPMRSLWYRKFGREPESPRPEGALSWLRRGVWLTPDTPGVRMFPMVLAIAPLWGGFAVNTLLYGALVAVPVMLPRAVRRAVRRRRGQCEECAYPIGASAVCTECGGPVGVRARAPV